MVSKPVKADRLTAGWTLCFRDGKADQAFRALCTNVRKTIGMTGTYYLYSNAGYQVFKIRGYRKTAITRKEYPGIADRCMTARKPEPAK